MKKFFIITNEHKDMNLAVPMPFPIILLQKVEPAPIMLAQKPDGVSAIFGVLLSVQPHIMATAPIIVIKTISNHFFFLILLPPS